MYDFYLVALLGVAVTYRSAAVGRTVIDEDELIVGICLLQYAFDAPLKITSYFVYGYYDAQFHLSGM